jgi:succinate dehydrogenase/fumarate reductase flavoprotein subunit
MTDRRQLADELWAAFKHWEGERKYALRQIIKHLEGEQAMSQWRFQVMRHTADTGDDYLAIHEFYTMHDGKEGWTQRPITIEADNLPAMRMALVDILRDLERHGVRDAKTGEPI